MKPAGIILAAGESSRMGRDKALLEFRGATFLNHLIALLLPRVAPLVVVLGHNAESIRPTIPARPDLEIVVNPRYKLGMLSSLQTAIGALPPETAAALITLVDLPNVRESTLDRLLAAFHTGDQPLAIPRHGDRRGHPLLASRKILDEFLQLPSDRSPKEVIRAHRAETLYVEVDDPGILHDIDLPSEYEALLKSN